MKQLGLYESNSLTLRPLRPRQIAAIDAIKQAIREGHKRIILQAPCGFGKTLTSAWMIAGALERGRRPLFTAPSVSLIDQTLEAFEAEGINDIGIMQADHYRTDHSAKVQIACVPTLVKRNMPDSDFMLIDEVHRQWKTLNERLDGPWSDKLAIGLSATPWAKGMGRRWTKLIIPATISDLIADGLLTPTRLYLPEAVANRGNLRVQNGEFTEASSEAEMSRSKIVGNVVDTWKKFGPGEKTFLFAVNLKHAKFQMAAFLDSGIPFGYIDANTPPGRSDREVGTRKWEFARMRAGEIAGIASVGCLIAGVDEDVRCIIDAKPKNSEMEHVQTWGRGIRTAAGKEFLIGLDHAGNNSEEGLGIFWEIFHDHLDCHSPSSPEAAYEGEIKPNKPKMCAKCRALIPAGRAVCFACGEPVRVNNETEHREGELRLYGNGKAEAAANSEQRWYSELLGLAKERGYSNGWAYHRFNDKFGRYPVGLQEARLNPSRKVREFDKQMRYKKQREWSGRVKPKLRPESEWPKP